MGAQHGKLGVALPPAAELVALVESGLTQAEIAERYGCSQSTVGQRLRDSGLLEQKPDPAEAEEPADVLAPLIPADWMDDALCAQIDPELFFPEKGGTTEPAKGICTGCTVQAECLDYAFANHERFGIWGGKSERERRKLARVYGVVPTPEEPGPTPGLFPANGDPIGVCEIPDCALPTYADKDGKPRRTCGKPHAHKLSHLKRRQAKNEGTAA